MAFIDSSDLFYPRGNIPARLIKPVNVPTDFPEVISTFYQWILELTGPKRPEPLKPCQGYTTYLEEQREVSTQRNIQEMNEVV